MMDTMKLISYFSSFESYFMKTILFMFLCFWLFTLNNVFALSVKDQEVANLILDHILEDTDDAEKHSDLVEWYYLIQDNASNTSNTVLKAKFDYIAQMLRWLIDSKKSEFVDLKDKNEKSFWLNYNDYITTKDVSLPDSCFKSYNLIDDMSRAENIPTSVVIATWKMESTCWFYYPSNWDWPFQMLYKNVTWEMTIPKFINEIQDFSTFIKNKWSWYNNANQASGYTVSMSYTGFEMSNLIKHSALYNWLSWSTVYWDIQPMNPDYVFGHYGDAYSWSNKDGLIVNVLKVIQGR